MKTHYVTFRTMSCTKFDNFTQVITSAVLWLLNYQTEEGAFVETAAYSESPFHRPMFPDPKADIYRDDNDLTCAA